MGEAVGEAEGRGAGVDPARELDRLARAAADDARACAAGRALGLLIKVVERLLAPDGCPWDRAQDPRSLRRYLLEECHEVLEAIDVGAPEAVAGELGDLLYQVVLQAMLLERSGASGLAEIAQRAAAKLVRRHPHVFGGKGVEDPRDARSLWLAAKRAEREGAAGEGTSVLDGLAPSLPALLRAQRLQQRAAEVGFDWDEVREVLAKLREEIGELEHEVAAGGGRARLEEELGDVLFSAVNLARHLGLSAEEALRAATSRFERRFRNLEALARTRGIDLGAAGLEQLEALWTEAKEREREAAGGGS